MGGRRPDAYLNREIFASSASNSPMLLYLIERHNSFLIKWCPRRDSNSHAVKAQASEVDYIYTAQNGWDPLQRENRHFTKFRNRPRPVNSDQKQAASVEQSVEFGC